MAKRSRKIVKPTLSKNQNGYRLWSCQGRCLIPLSEDKTESSVPSEDETESSDVFVLPNTRSEIGVVSSVPNAPWTSQLWKRCDYIILAENVLDARNFRRSIIHSWPKVIHRYRPSSGPRLSFLSFFSDSCSHNDCHRARRIVIVRNRTSRSWSLGGYRHSIGGYKYFV